MLLTKETKRKLLLSVISVALFFILLESGLRLINFNFHISDYIGKFDDHFQVDVAISQGAFLKDPVLFWRMAPHKAWEVNGLGIRDRRNLGEKKPGSFRIICLGSSVTIGEPLEYTKLEDTYPAVLEELLNASYSTNKIEVINAGVLGYTSYQGLKFLEKEVLKYRPDMVIVHFGYNDGTKALYFEDKEQPVQPLYLIKIQNLLVKSRLYQLLSKIIFVSKYNLSPRNKNAPSNKVRVTADDYRYNLELINEMGGKNGFKVLFIPPLLYDKGRVCYQYEYSIPENMGYVDYLQRFENERSKAMLFYDGCHLTPLGHWILAEEIADFLIKNNLLNAKK